MLCQIVQARLWAQGLTLGMLAAAGALKHVNNRMQEQKGIVKDVSTIFLRTHDRTY